MDLFLQEACGLAFDFGRYRAETERQLVAMDAALSGQPPRDELFAAVAERLGYTKTRFFEHGKDRWVSRDAWDRLLESGRWAMPPPPDGHSWNIYAGEPPRLVTEVDPDAQTVTIASNPQTHPAKPKRNPFELARRLDGLKRR